MTSSVIRINTFMKKPERAAPFPYFNVDAGWFSNCRWLYYAKLKMALLNPMNMIKRHEVSIFIISVLLLSSGITYISYVSGNKNLSFLSVFTPSLVALLLVALTDGVDGVKSLFIGQIIKRVKIRWALLALLIFPLMGAVALFIHSFFDGPQLSLRSTQLLPQIVVILLISLGEEFGWRGFLLPRLQKNYSVIVTALIVGIIWAAWHFPASMIGVGVPQDMSFAVFTTWVVLATLIIHWVYNNSGSVLLAIIMHSMANVTFNYLPLLPEFVGQVTTFYLFLGCIGLLSSLVIFHYRQQKRDAQRVA